MDKRYKILRIPHGYFPGGIDSDIFPTVTTRTGDAQQDVILEIYECNTKENISTPTKVSTGMSQRDSTEDNLGGGISRCVKTTDSLATLVMEEIEPNVLTPKRTEFGKAVRKQYEKGELEMSRHKMTELEPRTDGVSNTLTSVQKDNLVIEPKALSNTRDSNIVEPLNPYKDGTCRTIKAQYQQSSRANFARQDGLGATGVVQIGNIYPDTDGFKNRTSGRVNSAEGLSPTLRTVTGGHNEPKVVEDWQTVVGNKQLNPFRGSVEGTSPCITSACGAGGGMTPMLTDAPLETTKTKDFIEQVRGHEPMRYRIRKLTPRECFRLMGCDEETIDTIQAAGISNSQQYKLAGNSIVVDVLYHLFRKMFVETENESQQLTLF